MAQITLDRRKCSLGHSPSAMSFAVQRALRTVGDAAAVGHSPNEASQRIDYILLAGETIQLVSVP